MSFLARVANRAVRSSVACTARTSASAVAVAKPQIRLNVQRAWISDAVALENLKRNATMKVALNTLSDAPGAKKKAIRLGRGRGGRKGKTGGRGQDGQTGRQGGHVKLGFEGGQTPLYKKMRKYGFTNMGFKRTHQVISLARLQYWIDTGRIDASKPINMLTLIRSGCVGQLRKRDVGVKLLGDGAEWFNVPGLTIEVTQASQSAIDAVKAKGGNLKLVYYNKTGLHALLHPENFDQAGNIEPPKGLRKLPYCPPPPAHLAKKLTNAFEQPSQFPGFIKRQLALVEKAKQEGAAVPEATTKFLETLNIQA